MTPEEYRVHRSAYMKDYKDKLNPKRVWRRICIKYLGPRKSGGRGWK
jgi:hypothetical protein